MSSLVLPPTFSNTYFQFHQTRPDLSNNSSYNPNNLNSNNSSYNPNNLVGASYQGNLVFEKMNEQQVQPSQPKQEQYQMPGGLFGSAKKWLGNIMAKSSSSSSLDDFKIKPLTAADGSPLGQLRPIGGNANGIAVGPFNIPLATPFKFFSTNKDTGAVEYRQAPTASNALPATPEVNHEEKVKERSAVSGVS